MIIKKRIVKPIVIATVFVTIVTACAKKNVDEIAPTPPAVVVPPVNTTPTAKTTYNANVKSIINANCISCHGIGSSDGEYYDYATVKGGVSLILGRMNRAAGAGGFMPKNGTKVQADVDAVTLWQTDGLLEQ